MSGCQSAKVLSTAVCYSLVAIVTDLCCHLTDDSRGAWYTVYAMLLSNYEILPKIYTMKKLDFSNLFILK